MADFFSKGDRVVVVRSREDYKENDRGEVVESQNMSCQLERGYRVQLDSNGVKEILAFDLERECLTQGQIKNEISELKKLAKELKEEKIDKNLTNLQDALISKKKEVAKNEYNYITGQLSISNSDTVKKNTSLKKLKHHFEKCL